MNKPRVTRRNLLAASLKSVGVIASVGVAGSLIGCQKKSSSGEFKHGVASGDPLADRVIIWTRVSPAGEKSELNNALNGNAPSSVTVSWEVALDADFKDVVVRDTATTHAGKDFTLKVDVQGLAQATQYFFRFFSFNQISPVGRTKTLPIGDVEQITLAVASCANYPAGYFHAYRAIAERNDLDAVVHLGDYLYEYGQGGYASEDALMLGREVTPPGEMTTLGEYRARYGQYREDRDLQAAHQNHPFVCIWDDHEIANDSWREGAENHSVDEGDYYQRLEAALTAYAEWMPIRPAVNTDLSTLQRSFKFGNLVNLNMLDTRIVGRDKPLNLADFVASDGAFDVAAYTAAIGNPDRQLLGVEQWHWLQSQLADDSVWQVLGQQVLMAAMELPAAVVTGRLSIAEFARLAQLAQMPFDSLTEQQQAEVIEKSPLLAMGTLPYNLDAWDGYPAERARVLATAKAFNSNLVVLAGDTHNAWASNLSLGEEAVGVEFATSSVSSPGLEQYLGLNSQEEILQTEGALTALIGGLQYANLADRGYMAVTFTSAQASAEWVYVSSIKELGYYLQDGRQHTAMVVAGNHYLS